MSESALHEASSMEEAASHIRAEAEKRDKERLTIALVGRGGAGKSSLINTLVGRKVCEVGATTDKTKTAQLHAWKQVVFVDLPGYGTREFSLQRVMDEFRISSFDMFIWCANGKFLEEDLTVHDALKATAKPIIYVRTQCDNIYDEEKSDEEVEAEITSDLQRLIQTRVELLFVSTNRRYTKYRERLAKLTEIIEVYATEAGKSKADILYRDFQAFTEEFLKKKRASVEDMVLTHSFIAAANGVNPVPGLNITVDIGNVVKMLDRVSKAYNLDVIATMVAAGSPPTWLLAARSLAAPLATDGVLLLLKSAGTPAIMQQIGRHIPIFGMIVSAGLGFLVVRTVGLKYVDECHQAAASYLHDTLKKP
jgi:GTP-binding protein EngB required for normal cell division